ncbi:MAG: RNA polymerase sigma factor RpoD/SigA [candidate division KSB1 bacterium]|nr:RNA polymerase sigma factor RpoD/SigA [candidate division KSB1 bacterium]
MKNPTEERKSSDILAKYLRDIEKIPLLPPKEERSLAKRISQGDSQALARLVNANLRFVVFIAREYQDRGLPLDELISEGNMGLLEAARRFDAERGIKFISYAVWWIRQAILRALANHSRMVRLPINHIWALQKVVSIVEELEQALGRTPELEEVAAKMKISSDFLAKNMMYWGRELWLEDSTRPSEESLSLIDKLSSEEFAAPQSRLIQESMKTEIQLALASLTRCEATVLRLYFGIDQERPRTLLEIGQEMKLSRERIRQIKNKALQKLRYFHRREKLRPYLDD